MGEGERRRQGLGMVRGVQDINLLLSLNKDMIFPVPTMRTPGMYTSVLSVSIYLPTIVPLKIHESQ